MRITSLNTVLSSVTVPADRSHNALYYLSLWHYGNCLQLATNCPTHTHTHLSQTIVCATYNPSLLPAPLTTLLYCLSHLHPFSTVCATYNPSLLSEPHTALLYCLRHLQPFSTVCATYSPSLLSEPLTSLLYCLRHLQPFSTV